MVFASFARVVLPFVAFISTLGACSSSKEGTDGTDAGSDDSQCNVFIDSFVPAFYACGGDISGKWSLVDACMVAKAQSDCPASKTNLDYRLNAQWTFSGGTLSARTEGELKETRSIPSSCVTGSCDDYKGAGFGWTCTEASTCTCTQTSPVPLKEETFPYSLGSGPGTLTLGSGSYLYCVRSDTLYVMRTGTDTEPHRVFLRVK